jgi:hypothetical protein
MMIDLAEKQYNYSNQKKLQTQVIDLLKEQYE